MLIGRVARVDQKEVRWHVAQMLSRLKWNEAERQQVIEVLMEYLNDSSSIVKTFAMQALADLARQAPELRGTVTVHLKELTATGTPAMRARGRKLLTELGGLPLPSTPRHRKRRAE
jgi:HEAT repeat protein